MTFSDPASVTEVMKEKDHVLDNKKVCSCSVHGNSYCNDLFIYRLILSQLL